MAFMVTFACGYCQRRKFLVLDKAHEFALDGAKCPKCRRTMIRVGTRNKNRRTKVDDWDDVKGKQDANTQRVVDNMYKLLRDLYAGEYRRKVTS